MNACDVIMNAWRQRWFDLNGKQQRDTQIRW